jgi:hypothetical protein
MRTQIMANVVCIYVFSTLNLLHHNNIGVAYAKKFNFKIEPIRFVPLYSMAMLKSMIIITKAPFVTTPIHNIVDMRFKPQTPRGKELVRVHEKTRKVNKIFASQPSNPKEGGSDPPGPPRYFGLPMVNLDMPPLTPNRPYRQPLNYLQYVKDFDPNAHVKIFKAAIKQMVKQRMQKLLICLVLPSKILCLITGTIIWEVT